MEGMHPFKESGRHYEIEKIQEWHKEVLRWAVLGYRPGEIAKMTGYTKEHISNIFNSTIFIDQLHILQAARDEDSISVARRITELAPIAVERIREIISNPIHMEVDGEMKVDDRIEPSLKAKVSQDILDRAGHRAIDKGVIVHLTKKEMEDMKKDAIKAGIDEGYVVDAVVVEEGETEEIKDEHLQETAD